MYMTVLLLLIEPFVVSFYARDIVATVNVGLSTEILNRFVLNETHYKWFVSILQCFVSISLSSGRLYAGTLDGNIVEITNDNDTRVIATLGGPGCGGNWLLFCST